jgi:aspartyl/asparaginyl-tRNA synthetase
MLIIIPCYAQAVSSAELIVNAKQYDGKTVTYQGEAVGDIMRRGDYAWVNLNDGNAAIGVLVKKTDLADITYLGSYRAKGDVVEVVGIFNRSCPEHGGDLDIHAQEIKKIIPGKSYFRQLNMKKLYIGLLLTLTALLLYPINKFFQYKRK